MSTCFCAFAHIILRNTAHISRVWDAGIRRYAFPLLPKFTMATNLNEFENATVGASVGTVEVLCLQSLNYAKNMIQQGQPISMNPLVMYRGVGANCVNMGSCTMIQFALGGSLKKMVLGDNPKRNLKAHEEMLCGITAGVMSAVVGSPLELIMIQQQRKGGGIVETMKSISAPSTVMRGFMGAAVREGLWTCGYLSIPPIVRRTLMENYPETFDTNQKARVPAALLGGLFACYLTHPFDTIKTCMQGDIERKQYGTLMETSKTLYKEAGIPAFYRGATFRYGRMCCAVFIMDSLQVCLKFEVKIFHLCLLCFHFLGSLLPSSGSGSLSSTGDDWAVVIPIKILVCPKKPMGETLHNVVSQQSTGTVEPLYNKLLGTKGITLLY